jgi:hypothetical protein
VRHGDRRGFVCSCFSSFGLPTPLKKFIRVADWTHTCIFFSYLARCSRDTVALFCWLPFLLAKAAIGDIPHSTTLPPILNDLPGAPGRSRILLLMPNPSALRAGADIHLGFEYPDTEVNGNELGRAFGRAADRGRRSSPPILSLVLKLDVDKKGRKKRSSQPY